MLTALPALGFYIVSLSAAAPCPSEGCDPAIGEADAAKEEEKKERAEQDKKVVDEISKRFNHIQDVAVKTAAKTTDDEELIKLREENKKLQYRVEHLC